MGVHKHETGGYRAYKKINGKEYQFYSFDEIECNNKQIEFDQLALTTAKVTLFNKNGRFNGFSIGLIIRKNAKPYISARKQIVKRGELHKEEKTIKNTHDSIAWILESWSEYYDLNHKQLMDFSYKIKLAKALYLLDIIKAQEKIGNINE